MLNSITEWFRSCLVTQIETDKAHALNLATAALLVEISKADNHVSDSELATIIEAMRKRLGLDELEAQVQLADRAADHVVSLTEFTRLLNQNLTQEDRVNIVQSLWQVANADTDIDKYEEYYVRKIADLLYVSHSDFIRTKLRVVEAKRTDCNVRTGALLAGPQLHDGVRLLNEHLTGEERVGVVHSLRQVAKRDASIDKYEEL